MFHVEHGQVTIKTLKKLGRYTGFVVSGHADSAPHGKDIVCAGVSAIVQTAVIAIQHYTPVGISFGVSPGLCFLNLNDNSLEIAQVVIHSMILGLRALDLSHPDYLVFEEEVV